ncbi:hypothetical protein HMPREF3038_00065 [Akkermansia sp. KLE1797]|nr:hypothetical protein HMPREF3038_00065 [Akkermansia sp. KLE1797]KXU55720.1 hypothetical protein HMPREF3039_00073 [Akkermansia sp. KLE1798]
MDAFPKGAGRSCASSREGVQALPRHFCVHSRQQQMRAGEKRREKKPPVPLGEPEERFRPWFFSGIGLTICKS